MSATKNMDMAGHIVQHILSRWKGRSRLMEGMALFYWTKVAGPDIARKTQAEKMMAGTLWIRTNDPTLAHHLTFLVPKMIEKYQAIMGPKIVRGIRFVVGQIEMVEPEPVLQSERTPLPEFILEAAAIIEDDKLRSSFLRAAQNSLNKETLNREKGWKTCSCGILTEDGDNCPHCQRKEDEEKKTLLFFFLTRHPELSWEESRAYLPEIERIDWEKAKQGMRQKYENQLRILVMDIRKSKKGNISVLIEPTRKYLSFGGGEKEIQHLIGIDNWNSIRDDIKLNATC